MKKIFLSLLLPVTLFAQSNLMCPSCAGTTQGRGLRVATSGQVKTVNSIIYFENGDNFSTLLTAIGTRKVTLVMDTIAAISANTAIPATITVAFSPYGGFNVATTKTLTILNMEPPARYKVFYSSGTGNTLVPMGIPKFPEWWGAVPDGVTSSNAAFQFAIASKGVLDCDTGTYILSQSINLVDLQIVGKGVRAGGAGQTVLKFNALDTSAAFYTRLSANSSKTSNAISHLTIQPNSWTAVTGSRGYGLNIESPITMTDVVVEKFYLSGILFHGGVVGGGPYNSVITNVRSEYNGNHGILVGTGANVLLLVQLSLKWNGATAYGVAPVVAGLYDGLRVQRDSAGNPGGAFGLETPKGIHVLGGDASYNSLYGWNFSQTDYSIYEPGFSEGNLVDGTHQIFIGDSTKRCFINPAAVSGDTAGVAYNSSTYKRTNILFVGGRLVGQGPNRELWSLLNLKTYLGESANLSHTAYAQYDIALNRLDILATGSAQTKIGTANHAFISNSAIDTILGPVIATSYLTTLGNVGIGANANGGILLDVGVGVSGVGVTGVNQYGAFIRPILDTTGTTVMYGLAAKVIGADAGGAYTTATYRAINAQNITKGTNQTVTTAVGLEVDNITSGTTNFAIRTGTGIIKLGDATDATSVTTGGFQTLGGAAITKALWLGGLFNCAGAATITGITTHSARVGIGGSANGGVMLDVGIGTGNAGVTGTSQYGVYARPLFGTDATANQYTMRIAGKGADGSYTTTNHYGTFIEAYTKGSSQIVTNAWGLNIASVVAGATINRAIETGTGIVVFGDATDATNATTAAVKTSGGIAAAKGIAIGTNLSFGANILASATAPTISSGFGTSPTIASNNGTAAFTVNVGTGGVATSGVIGLPTVTTGWHCFCEDRTTYSATVFMCRQTAFSTTSATIGQFTNAAVAQAWTASDILKVSCFAY